VPLQRNDLKIMKILVTGANGFVGNRVLLSLIDDSAIFPVGSLRSTKKTSIVGAEFLVVGEISGETDWSQALLGMHAVVHTAARVHITTDASTNSISAYSDINVQGTLNLALQAAACGVKRFIFVSTIKVNGEITQLDSIFTPDDNPNPLDPYGISKMEAEVGLREIALKTGMEVVIIRPPLVYGLGVKANFATMIRFVSRGIPIPLGAIHNKRSFVALDNLVDLIMVCLTHPAAADETFLVSDGEDVSTTELLRRLGAAMGKPARLIPIPASLLKLAASIIGKSDVAQRLCGSLQVDIEKTRRVLGWTPPLTLDEGLKKAVEGFQS
jgi:UDP-glucose 4-epimerase